ncbi:hypothetical protein SARC_00116 [Sphaeroforma arctica JP610]|uniref:Uncharacterized protein n=1 Tax=Sphaeroforma arctica JP610 TaxID=667725 RepID=A0A0L0GG61_9EUKA|nr:hypothetical protein SARC_00116 [Sphaeroforma arctica JP610]KNC87859.1 hypothetical protein SARC_00116 [Sphaeroforma arctica JP610]|eukprot:XP_014161761.1 hypothetical protein SARC_00116 [Sphaeroforma arctica JP610]
MASTLATFTLTINGQALDLSADKTMFETTTRTGATLVASKFVFEGDPATASGTACEFNVRMLATTAATPVVTYLMKRVENRIVPEIDTPTTQGILLTLKGVVVANNTTATTATATATGIGITGTTDVLGLDPLTAELVVDAEATPITQVVLTFDSATGPFACVQAPVAPVAGAAAPAAGAAAGAVPAAGATETGAEEVSALDKEYGPLRLQTWLFIGGGVTLFLFFIIIVVAVAMRKPKANPMMFY